MNKIYLLIIFLFFVHLVYSDIAFGVMMIMLRVVAVVLVIYEQYNTEILRPC